MDGKTRRHLNDPIEALVLSASDGDEDTLVTYRTVRNARGRSRH
jgi:hypothetical protein